MPTQEKIEAVAELKEQVSASSGIYLAEYKGLSVQAISDLRKQMRDAGAQMIVAKNRLFKLALDGTSAEGLSEHLAGPNAVFFCTDDPVAPAKVVADFAKDHPTVVWKGGYIDGAVLDARGMERIAYLPSKQEIVAGVVGGVSSPITGFVFTLNGLVSDLVYTLQAVADQKQSA